jgi:hypothetical protein
MVGIQSENPYYRRRGGLFTVNRARVTENMGAASPSGPG